MTKLAFILFKAISPYCHFILTLIYYELSLIFEFYIFSCNFVFFHFAPTFLYYFLPTDMF